VGPAPVTLVPGMPGALKAVTTPVGGAAPAEASVPPEVLAARALKEKPAERPAPGDTIFGEDLISEKSLDEVILSYLADEN
jgi:hypothetical protein